MSTETLSLMQTFHGRGQGHVFAFWPQLDEAQRHNLISQASEIDLDELEHLVTTLVKGAGCHSINLKGLEPAPYLADPDKGGDPDLWRSAHQVGEAALRAGQVAAFTVAGGQGTRLGYNGPKGTFPVTPVKRKTLFQVFAEKIAAASKRYQSIIPWYIMTSHANHAATVQAFEENHYFGLAAENVYFFMQGRMPAVDLEGKIILEAPDTIAMSPDGHGGSLRALVRSGAVADMRRRGIRALSYFQVDNPLVRCIDPTFIGFHLQHDSDMSSKMIPKAYPAEKVGHFCMQNGRMVVIEYSDMPMAMQEMKGVDGQLHFLAGSIAIHLLKVKFVDRLGSGKDASFALPFHRADKKIKTIDAEGKPVIPDQPNGVKFEMFVFDALPFAANPVVIETRREDDFSPVKNATGLDSLETCQNDQVRQWTRWLKAAGVSLPTDDSGLPRFLFEISPLFADTVDSFVERWQSLASRPHILPNLYLD